MKLEEKIAIVEEYVKRASQPPGARYPTPDTPPTLKYRYVGTFERGGEETHQATDSAVTDLSHHVSADSGNVPINTIPTSSTIPFVHNRVSKIRLISTSWRYCHRQITWLTYSPEKSPFNLQLHSSVQWRHGPTWLTSQSKWPVWPQAEILLI